jgi:hypothetical protein
MRDPGEYLLQVVAGYPSDAPAIPSLAVKGFTRRSSAP